MLLSNSSSSHFGQVHSSQLVIFFTRPVSFLSTMSHTVDICCHPVLKDYRRVSVSKSDASHLVCDSTTHPAGEGWFTVQRCGGKAPSDSCTEQSDGCIGHMKPEGTSRRTVSVKICFQFQVFVIHALRPPSCLHASDVFETFSGKNF